MQPRIERPPHRQGRADIGAGLELLGELDRIGLAHQLDAADIAEIRAGQHSVHELAPCRSGVTITSKKIAK